MRHSFVLTSALPSASKDMLYFEVGLSELRKRAVSCVEYFAEFNKTYECRNLLDKYGFNKRIFLAAAYQKKNKISLCDIDEEKRRFAVSETMKCFQAAVATGADTVLITSGFYPEKNEKKSWDNLKKSVVELSGAFPQTSITIEPGDRNVDACQLAGPTNSVVSWIQNVRELTDNVWLTMDTSHIAQLGENPFKALELSREFCRHIHIANCVLKKGNMLYGDKHPFFDHPDAVFSKDELIKIEADLLDTDNIVAIEIINREDNELEGFDRILKEEEWFFDYGLQKSGKAGC